MVAFTTERGTQITLVQSNLYNFLIYIRQKPKRILGSLDTNEYVTRVQDTRVLHLYRPWLKLSMGTICLFSISARI